MRKFLRKEWTRDLVGIEQIYKMQRTDFLHMKEELGEDWDAKKANGYTTRDSNCLSLATARNLEGPVIRRRRGADTYWTRRKYPESPGSGFSPHYSRNLWQDSISLSSCFFYKLLMAQRNARLIAQHNG
jgi:hypothetical protein